MPSKGVVTEISRFVAIMGFQKLGCSKRLVKEMTRDSEIVERVWGLEIGDEQFEEFTHFLYHGFEPDYVMEQVSEHYKKGYSHELTAAVFSAFWAIKSTQLEKKKLTNVISLEKWKRRKGC